MPREVALTQRDAERRGDLKHHAARDAIERTGTERRRGDRTVADDEDIVARAFGHEALIVQHQPLFRTGLDRLHFRHHVVEVIQRLHLRRQDVVPRATRRDRRHHEPIFIRTRRIELDARRDDEHRRLRAFVRREPHRPHAARDHRADVAVAKAVRLHRLHGRADQFLGRHRDREQQRFRAVVDTPRVLFETEDAPIVKADALEAAVAIKQAVIEDRNLRLRFRDNLSVEVNEQFFRHASRGRWQAARRIQVATCAAGISL